jgi:hypothetical protein
MFKKVEWYFNRLKAMNLPEVGWRLQQKMLQKKEQSLYGKKIVVVGSYIFDGRLSKLEFNHEQLGINFNNIHHGLNTEPCELKGPDYGKWPLVFSYNLDYKQRDDLGDARTNWEKNRHFEWALLAKAYFVTRDGHYLRILAETVDKWQSENPFLHGISWTSAMEFAIRSINWMYALAFIRAAGQDIDSLRVGIINMVSYLTKHYSRYSSANNHLLVEASAIGLAGYAFNYKPWRDLAIDLLSDELEKQNYSDGVNKELSLHYQTFGMEAYLLLAHVSGESRWNTMLKMQCEYVAHATWRGKAVCEFGDDDEGKILDLQGGKWHQWEWVLQLGSLITGTKYSCFDEICENTYWLFTDEEIAAVTQGHLYDASSSRCFKEGGNTFMRDRKDRVLIGIDHAALGFGSIAAHGHADALSFQILVDGLPVITDPGTFIYHCDLEQRNLFRKTINHSTVCIGGKDQSEMLGAFLWGKRAKCTLERFSCQGDKIILTANHDGYRPIVHQRTFEWDCESKKLRVNDLFTEESDWISTLMLGNDVSIVFYSNDMIELQSAGNLIIISVNSVINKLKIEDTEISKEYGVKCPSKAIRIYGQKKQCSIDIDIKLK